MLSKFFASLFLWGPIPTIFKVIGRKRFLSLPLPFFRRKSPSLALIGCGQFPFSTILPFVYLSYGAIFRRMFDPYQYALSTAEKMFRSVYKASSVSDILRDPLVDLVYIASPHSTHTEYAVKCLEANKDVYIEKPLSTSFSQLANLVAAQKKSNRVLYTGFNRPHSPILSKLRSYYKNNTSPFICNIIVYGHFLPSGHWYRNEGEGSRIAGNCTHWIDLAIHMFSWSEIQFPLCISIHQHDTSFDDENLTLNLKCNGSSVSITFCALHEPLKGVTEYIHFHSHSFTAFIDNFKSIRFDIGASCFSKHLLYKNAGHRNAVLLPLSSDPVFARERMNESLLSTELSLYISSMIANSQLSGYFCPTISSYD